jgi:release factor H-coupled RctB family protein
MSRQEALQKMKHKYHRQELRRTEIGSRVICDRNELLYEEHPDAYKSLSPVKDALIAADLAAPIAKLTPLVTVKQ